MKKKPDILIILSIIGLCTFSLFNLFGISQTFFVSQLMFIVAGFIAFFVMNRVGINILRINAWMTYVLFIILLIATYITGDVIRGSRRWIDLVVFNFQPSEFMKPFFVIFMADLFAKKSLSTSTLLKAGSLFSIVFLIILKQPDLGSALLYLGVFVGMIFFAGLSLIYFISGALFFLVSSPLLWSTLKPYQKQRVFSFIDPSHDISGVAYNVIQSVITVGSGGLVGKGLGLGTQSRFLFLPENHTDFAFASLVEQFGFIGGAAIIGLYCVLLYRLLLVVRERKKEYFYYLYTVGVILFITISVIINVGMNMGIFPVTGIALPFVSYGGSSVVSTMILIGLAL